MLISEKLRSGGQKAKSRTELRSGAGEGGWGEGPEGVASRPYGVKIFARPRFLPRSERKAFCYWGSATEFRFLLRKMRRLFFN